MKYRFKDLTDQDKEYIRVVHKNSELPFQTRMDILKGKYGVAERAIRKWIERLGYSKYQEVENEEVRVGKIRGHNPEKKVKIICWAQNATPLHGQFFANILTYADFRDAEVFVINGRYQNPTSLFSEGQRAQEWWEPKVVPYLCGSQVTIHKNLQILGNIRIVPTAQDPFSDLESISGGKSCVIGHPRVHLKSLPVLEGHHKKLMLTTGAVTLSNYTETKAGARGEFHHSLGFVIVEIKDDDIFYIRQITATPDGKFTDLVYHVDGEVWDIDSSAAFIKGDLHVDEVEEEIVTEALRYFKKVRPEKLFLHDVLNGSAINHHELNDPIARYQRYKDGESEIGKEIDRVIAFFEKHKLTDYSPYVVRSNHDYFLEKWILAADWKKDVPNSKEYLEYSLALLNGDAPKGVFPYLLERHFGDRIRCLDFDESVVVKDFELGQHGHLGTNGSKGSIETYRKLNIKTVTGDSHTINRKDGALSVGTNSKLRQGYNHGASAWGWADVVIHQDGKAQHIIYMVDKKFTTLF